MRLPRLPFPSSPLTAWAVEDTSVQLTWGSLPTGEVRVTATTDSSTTSIVHDHPGGPGGLDVHGLEPDSTYRFTIEVGKVTHRCRATTSTPPPGAELCRIATISDLHLGSDHFGASKQMVDRPGRAEPFAMRSADDAIRSAIAWGATHLIIKGDAAHHGRAADFQMLGDLVDRFPELPMSLLPGNHDTDLREVPLPVAVGARELAYEPHVSHVDLDGIRLVFGDTTIKGEGPGTLAGVGEDLLTAASESPTPGVLVAVHQQLQTSDPNRYWPPGIPSSESDSFLDRLDRTRPGSVVTSGHTHRNRSRRHGSLLVTEVAATHHWPGVWAGYVVHEGGIRQVVRRIVGADIVEWHEYSKNAVGGVWGLYAPGRLRQRCISHHWAS